MWHRTIVHAAIASIFLTAGLLRAETPSVITNQQDFRQIVNAAKEMVFPAVVFIKCVQETHQDGSRQTVEVSGSGVLISADGQVLTNWHVVEKTVEIRCLLLDGRAMDAKLVGSDKDTDVALIQLKLPEGTKPLAYASLGDSTKLTEGDFVMAMGAPWGLSRSVSIGIISCTGRFLPDSSEYSLWLQTDASISPGNSGGPLVNTLGQVIGLNTRGVMQGGDMGFAIPSQTLREVIPKLREHGKIPWTWTGIQLQPLKDFSRSMYFEGTTGVIVADTDNDSPARRAGIQSRDRIMSVAGQPVKGLTDEDLPDIRRLLALQPADKPIQIELERGGKTQKIELIARQKGSTQGEELDCPRWDFSVKTINQFDNPNLFAMQENGVFVYGIRSPGNAATSGLQENDILLKIQNREVKSLDDVREVHEKAIKNVADEHRIILTVLRNGLMRQVVLDFARDYTRR